LLCLDQQDDAELQVEIAERKAKGFRVLVVGWKTQEKPLCSLMSLSGVKRTWLRSRLGATNGTILDPKM
jgi:hypothetical protein